MKRVLMLLAVLLSTAATLSAQKAERDFIRRGNRSFNDSTYVNAEVNYRKAIDANPSSAVAMYNLGNTLLMQNKGKDAAEQYNLAAKIEKDKSKLAQIYHNMGVLAMAGKEYEQAVGAFRHSLLNNPKDDETRYNLSLAQKLLKQQQQQQQQNKDKENKDQQKQEDKQQQQQQQQDQQKEQEKQQQQQQQQQENQMSKENAEQMLQSVMQDEKDTQDKVKKQQQVIQGGKLEKNW
jgi:tetratricopeptide (TPR) repeat protein